MGARPRPLPSVIQQPELVSNSPIFSKRLKTSKWDVSINKEKDEIQSHLTDSPQNMKTTYGIGSAQERLCQLSLTLSKVVGEDDFIADGIRMNQNTEKVDNYDSKITTSVTNNSQNDDLQEKDLDNIQNAVIFQKGQDQKITDKDVEDFEDANIQLFEEGKAVSELEIYSIAFDNCIKVLKTEDKNIINTLIQCKNYYVNKATRHGQHMVALEKATKELDQQVQGYLQDLTICREQLGQKSQQVNDAASENVKLQQRIDQLFNENNELHEQVNKLSDSNQQLNKAADLLAQENKQLEASENQLNKRIKHITAISQRLRQVSDQSLEKLHVSEKKVQQHLNELVSITTKNKDLQQQINELTAEYAKQIAQQQKEREQFEAQKLSYIQKLYKYGETDDQNQQGGFAIDIKEAIQTAVRLNSDDARQKLSNLGVSQEGLLSFQKVLQQLNKEDAVQDVMKQFVSATIEEIQKTSKTTQTIDYSRANSKQNALKQQLNNMSKSVNSRCSSRNQSQASHFEDSLFQINIPNKKASQFDLQDAKTIRSARIEILSRQFNQQSCSINEISEVSNASQVQQIESRSASASSVVNSPMGQLTARDILSELQDEEIISAKNEEQSQNMSSKKNSNILRSPLPENHSLQNKDKEQKKPQLVNNMIKKGSKDKLLIDSKIISKNQEIQEESQDNSGKLVTHNSFSQDTAQLVDQQIDSKAKLQPQMTDAQTQVSFQPTFIDADTQVDTIAEATQVQQQKPTVENVEASQQTNEDYQSIQQIQLQSQQQISKQEDNIVQLTKEKDNLQNELLQKTTETVQLQNQVNQIKIQLKQQQEQLSETHTLQRQEAYTFILPQKDIKIEMKDETIQVEPVKDNVAYLKFKINELLRRCQDAGILEKGETTLYNDLTNFQLLDNQPNTQYVAPDIKQIQLSEVQVLNQPMKPQTKTQPVQDIDSESSISATSFIHEAETDQRLTKYVKEVQEDADTQTMNEVADISMQTEKIIEDFVQFNFNTSEENIDDFCVANELKLDKQDIDVFKPEEVVVDNMKLSELPTLQDFQKQQIQISNDKRILDRQIPDEILQKRGQITQEEFQQEIQQFVQSGKPVLQSQQANMPISSLSNGNTQKSLINSENTKKSAGKPNDNKSSAQNTSNPLLPGSKRPVTLISTENEIPTFEEYFAYQMQQSDRFALVQPSNPILSRMRHERQFAQMQEDFAMQSAHFQLGIARSSQQQLKTDKDVKRARSRQSEISKLVPNADRYVNTQYSHQQKDVTVVLKSNFQTYSDFVKSVTLDSMQFKICKTVKQSLILLHPRIPQYSGAVIDTDQLYEQEVFRIPHILDRLYYKYEPMKADQQVAAFPAVLRGDIPLSQLFSDNGKENYQRNTLVYFQNEINQAHLVTLKQGRFEATDILTQFGQQLFPLLSQQCQYIRLSAVTFNDKIPPFFTKLQNYCKIIINVVQINRKQYIEIPLKNVIIKPINQVIKLTRQLIKERLNSQVSHIQYMKSQATKELDASQDSSSFETVPALLCKKEAENLADFVLSFAKRKYGSNILVQTFIWTLIANTCYYQYDNEELYLFNRLLFGQLPHDFLLLYLDLCDLVDIQQFAEFSGQQHVLVDNLPVIVQRILPSFDASQQRSLLQSIYALLYNNMKQKEELENKSIDPPQTLNFTILASSILHSYNQHRVSIFKSVQFIYEQLSKNDQTYPDLNFGGFQTLMETILPNIQPSFMKEQYFATVGDLNQQMSYYQFQNLFQSFQLGRFVLVPSSKLDVLASSELKRLVKNFVLFFNNYRKVLLKIEILMRRSENEEMATLYLQIKNMTGSVQANILGYDFYAAVEKSSECMKLVTEALLKCKAEGALYMLGGAINSLNSFLECQKEIE